MEKYNLSMCKFFSLNYLSIVISNQAANYLSKMAKYTNIKLDKN